MKLDYTKVDSVQEKDVPYLDEGVEKTADLIRTTYTPTNFEGTTTSFSIRGTHPNRDYKLEKFEDDLHRQWLVELGYDLNKYYVDKHTKEIKEIVEEADELGADPTWNILQDVESESSQEI